MTPELEAALAECKAIKPLSIYLFHNRRGQSYLADDRSYEGFSSMWSRWMAKLPKEKRFGVRTLRNLVGSQDDLATASERLGHASSTTTQKHYRSNTSKVRPCIHRNHQDALLRQRHACGSCDLPNKSKSVIKCSKVKCFFKNHFVSPGSTT